MNTELLLVARRLDYLIGQVTPDEFAWQDANYERDSVLGRELLFLIANDSWIRATSEIIDIARSDAIETTIEVDVDLSQITHEAFRDRTGQIWLPIAVLPPLRQQLLDYPEPFSTLTVKDASGAPLMMLPRADIRHQLAAALTEIIVKVAVARLPGISVKTFTPGRNHRLVLSAAIYRLLRNEIVPEHLLRGNGPMREPWDEMTRRLGTAQNETGDMLAQFARLLNQSIPADQVNRLDARRLTERAIRVLDAMTKSAVIVIPAELPQRPSVLTVTLPGRALHSATTRWAEVFGPDAAPHRQWVKSRAWRRRMRVDNWIFPSASLHLDLLLPSASTDRQVRVNLPEGISPDPSRVLARRADLDVRCRQPPAMQQLAVATRHLLDADPNWPHPLRQSLADLALGKADAIQVALRDHHAGAEATERQLEPEQARQRTKIFRDSLQALNSALHMVAANGRGEEARDELGQAWAGGEWLSLPMQRRTSTDTVSPGVVAARVRAIDDVAQRSATTSARMEVRLAVTDSSYYNTARLSGLINLLLMFVVLCFYGIRHFSAATRHAEPMTSPEVLAVVLTLFSAIQLGRFERGDRSIMRGLLVPDGNPLIIATILPTVVLAVSVAFSRSFIWIEGMASGCIAALAILLFLGWRRHRALLYRGRPVEEGSPEPPQANPGRESDLLFYTDEPDYAHDQVLHSNWWRTTTAEALMMDRAAHGYVIWQRDDQRTLDSLLSNACPAREPAANVLALQRSGTYGQMLNFAVFRDEPGEAWEFEHAKPVMLSPIMLTLGVDSTFGVFIGLPWYRNDKVRQHLVTAVLQLATKHGLATCETRLPAPAPDASYADLHWCRIELSARPEDLDHIYLFLANLLTLIETAASKAIVGVRTRHDGSPRILNPRPRSTPTEASDLTRLALATDLDIVARSEVFRENPDDANWRVMAICDNWRMGIEGSTLAMLDPEQALIGLTTTVLYGQSVLLVLCYAPTGSAPGDDPALGQFIRFEQWQNRTELGTARRHPLLRVYLRTPDRPGATIGVLDSLREAIRHEAPTALEHGDISVWYARVEVKDGDKAHVQFTVMLPTADDGPSPAVAWTASDLWHIERRALYLLAAGMADGNHSKAVPISGADLPPDTTIQLGLITMPDLARSRATPDLPVGPAAEAQSSADALPMLSTAGNRRDSARARPRFLLLVSISLLLFAISIASTGVAVSGPSFLPWLNELDSTILAVGTLLGGAAALVAALKPRRTTEQNGPKASSKSRRRPSEPQPHLLTAQEFALIEARRRRQQLTRRAASHRRGRGPA